MSDIMLHHYDLSPFSEKIRIALAYKGLQWHSVKVDAVPPRPLLEEMTGGYRRLPVMQIGADIYCDTEVIFRTLERLQPTPTLYPTGEGIAKALSHWWDRATWKPSIGILVHYIGEHLPEAFLKDRKENYLGYDISKEAMAPMMPAYVQQMTAYTQWLSSILKENGPYLTGKDLSAADLTCYHTLWLLRRNAGKDEIDTLLGLQPLVAWMDRIAAITHAPSSEVTPEQALAKGKVADPAATDYLRGGDPSGIAPGTRVSVTPEDNARVPVEGILVAADAQEIVVRREYSKTGAFHVHFPRAGFDTIPLSRAKGPLP